MKYYEDDLVRAEIDKHLEQIASYNAQLGTDSIDFERLVIRANINKHLESIRLLDLEFYQRICPEK